MTEPKQAAFEGWAVVELFGHQQEIGFVTTEAYGSAVLFRVDRPELPEREYILERPEYIEYETIPKGSKVKRQALPAKSRLLGPGAIYALNPCTEEMARKAIERNVPRPLVVVELAKVAQLATGGEILPGEPDPDEEEGDDPYGED